MLSAAAVSSLHAERFAVGSAVNQTARQVGGALGVALLVVILGTPTVRGRRPSTHFRHLWWYAAAMAVSSGLVCLMLRARPASAASPAPTDGAVVGVGRSPMVVAARAGRDPSGEAGTTPEPV